MDVEAIPIKFLCVRCIVISVCDLWTKMSVDSHQTCLICATISLRIFEIVIKCQWLRYKLHKTTASATRLKNMLQAMFFTYPIQLWVR